MMSDSTGTTQQISISRSWVKSLVLVSGFLLLIIIALVVDYFGLIGETFENKRLHIENARLLKQFQEVEGKLSTLETNLDRIKTFTTKLRLITNIDSEDRSLNVAMGAEAAKNQPVNELDQPMDERATTEELSQKSEPSQPQVNEAKGDLALHGARDYGTLVIRLEKSVKEALLREQSVLDLWESLSERQTLLASTPNIKPARGWITSKFGYRASPFTGKPALHAGLDIAAAPGSPVFAPADGMVTFAGYDEGYGKMITIDHGYGISTRFGHNAQIYVQVGQRVSRWDVISSVGNTGRSTGPHLHYEVRINGVPRDPSVYILND